MRLTRSMGEADQDHGRSSPGARVRQARSMVEADQEGG